MNVIYGANLKTHTFTAVLACTLAALPVELPFTAAAQATAFAQEEAQNEPRRPSRRAAIIRARLFDYLEKTQTELDMVPPNFAAATKILLEAEEKTRNINDYERANLNIMRALIAYEQNDTQRAIALYEHNLRLTEVPSHIHDQALFTLAQLYMSIDEWQKVIDALTKWFATTETTPNETPFVILSKAHFELKRFDQALTPLLKAIAMHEDKGQPVTEPWWQMLMSIYYEQRNLPQVKQVLITLVLNHSKPHYWTQLAAVESELVVSGEPEGANEKRSLAVLDTAYRLGYLQTEAQLVHLAQLYLYHGTPILAAWLLEKQFEAGTVERIGKNYELLSQAYINARETRKALEPLRLAATASEEGELYVRLAQVHFELDEYEDCISSMEKGLQKGKLKNADNARQIMGMCAFNKDTIEGVQFAIEVFENLKLSDDIEIAKSAEQWHSFLIRDRKRRENLARENLG